MSDIFRWTVPSREPLQGTLEGEGKMYEPERPPEERPYALPAADVQLWEARAEYLHDHMDENHLDVFDLLHVVHRG